MENNELSMTLERLAAAAGALEQAVVRLGRQQTAFTESAEANIGRIVATVGATAESQREGDLEEKLVAAERRIAELEAQADSRTELEPQTQSAGRKTLPAASATLLAKHGLAQGQSLDSIDAGAVDAALASLSIEQRIAVKSQLLRAGLLG